MIESMREIGGYFGLELPVGKPFLHGDGYCVNSGRNALELILSNIQDLEKLWIPYYTCEVILEPLKRQGIPYDFYSSIHDMSVCNTQVRFPHKNPAILAGFYPVYYHSI